MTDSILREALTFDDVLLLPAYADFLPANADVSTRFTRELELRIPFVSSAMDTVTEWRTAVTMAREGGIGILHRFMTIEQQCQQVRRVKRAEGFVVDAPYAVRKDASLDEAARIMEQQEVGGLVVQNGADRLLGLITRRDVSLAPDSHQTVADVMTPIDQIVSVGPEVSAEEGLAAMECAEKILASIRKHKWE